jgi:uncharacterized membrane protein
MTVPLITVAQGSDSDIATARRVLIRDAAAWSALWAEHAGPGVAAPAIDFESRIVAAVFAGERPSPGHAIEIADARTDAGVLTLIVRERTPPRGMAAAQILVSPFHIVTLPRVDADVRFTEGSVTSALPLHVPLPGEAQPQGSRDASASSTGLDPNFAAALSYLAGPFSGILILLVERSNRYVRFHAWQAVLGLGGLGLLAIGALFFSFLTLLISPLLFTVMYRLSEIVALVWVAAWLWCLVKAFTGHAWKMPVAGRHAERLATGPFPPG